MLLSIIIVSYNSRDLLDGCLSSILSYPPNCSFEVIVVDNGSSDGSQSLVKDRYSLVKIMELRCNMGFSKANNIGIKESKGDYILLLNADTLVDPQALDGLLDFARGKEDLGMVGPKLLNPDGTVQPSCFDFPTVTKNLMHLLNLTSVMKRILRLRWVGGTLNKVLRKDFAYRLNLDFVHEIDYVMFACALVPRRVFRQIGYLDDSLFLYHEECEFGYRLRHYGLKSFFFPGATVVHLGGGSSRPQEIKMFLSYFQSLLCVLRKHSKRFRYLLFKVTIAWGIVIRILLLPFSGGKDFGVFTRYKCGTKSTYSFVSIKNAFKAYVLVLSSILANGRQDCRKEVK